MIVPIINRQKLKHPKDQDTLIIPFTWPETSETINTNSDIQVKLLDANGRSLWSAPSSADEFAAPHEIKYKGFAPNDDNEIHIPISNIVGRTGWPVIMLVSLLYKNDADTSAMDSVAEIIVKSDEPSNLSTKIDDVSLNSDPNAINYYTQPQAYQIIVDAKFDALDVPIYLTAQVIDNMKNIVIDEMPLFYYNECYASSLPIIVGYDWQQIKIKIIGETELGHSIDAEYKVYFTPGVANPKSAVLSNSTPIIGEMTLGFIPWM